MKGMIIISEINVKGYAGKLLRVDMTSVKLSDTIFNEKILKSYIGGTGIGSKILYDEVPPEINGQTLKID